MVKKKATPAEEFVANKRKKHRERVKALMYRHSPFYSGYGIQPQTRDTKEDKRFQAALKEMRAAGRKPGLANPDKWADEIATWIEDSDRRRAEEPTRKPQPTRFRLRKLKDAAKARARRGK